MLQGAGHHPGFVELAGRSQGFRGVRREGLRHHDRGQSLHVRLPDQRTEETRRSAPLARAEKGSIAYLSGVVRGHLKLAGLNSLENKVVVA